jgi:hypothetical protein
MDILVVGSVLRYVANDHLAMTGVSFLLPNKGDLRRLWLVDFLEDLFWLLKMSDLR